MRVPAGTEVRVESSPTTNYLLSEGGETPSWRVRLAMLTASRAGSTPESQCKSYLDDLRAKGQQFKTLVDESSTIGGVPAHTMYLEVPLETGGNGITGTVVVARSPDTYLVFSILVVHAEFARAKNVLQAMLETLTLREMGAVALAKRDFLVKGTEIINGFSEERLRATLSDAPRCYRMWRPGPDGAQKDFGYTIVRVREGKRGEVDASRDSTKLRGEDGAAGLFAMVDARVVVGDDATHTLDVQSRYFMTWDRTSEAWSIRSTERHRRASRSSAQTGVRAAPTAGRPRATIDVIQASLDGTTREPLSWPVPPAYISQAELIVLGQLLPRPIAPQMSVEFSDYAFDQRDAKLPQRREVWTQTERGYKLETRFGNAPAALVQEFDRDGVRTRRVDLDGTVTERIALDELRALWKSKGLPVD
ncbi:MAG: hypothetical protein QM516_02300 [Limnohabitans sp.]|nr:hypothetical protein [Limnohabitans sp.]